MPRCRDGGVETFTVFTGDVGDCDCCRDFWEEAGLGSALAPLGGRGTPAAAACRSHGECPFVEGEELPESEVWLLRRDETGMRDWERELGRGVVVEDGDAGD